MHGAISSMFLKIWKRLTSKRYRDSFVAAHVSNTIASQIAMLRQAEGWTQTDLAKKAGMHQSRISSLEDPNYENIEVRTLTKLASAFDVALIVRFAPFSVLADWAANLSPHNLLVQPFTREDKEARRQSKPFIGSSSEDIIATDMILTGPEFVSRVAIVTGGRQH